MDSLGALCRRLIAALEVLATNASEVPRNGDEQHLTYDERWRATRGIRTSTTTRDITRACSEAHRRGLLDQVADARDEIGRVLVELSIHPDRSRIDTAHLLAHVGKGWGPGGLLFQTSDWNPKPWDNNYQSPGYMAIIVTPYLVGLIRESLQPILDEE